MPETLLYIHSLLRWFVLFSLLASIVVAWRGLSKERTFSRLDNALRHWTATIAHVQLIVGILLYTQSAVIRWFWGTPEAAHDTNGMFFGIVHVALMLIAIVVITIGSALARRASTDPEKFGTMLLWFAVALVLILIAIPWPFSPLAERPYLR